MRWRTGILLTCIVGAGVLAYQIGARLSDEAIMTIAGVSCGILASIPVSIGLLIALTRERAAYLSNDDVESELEPAPAPYNVYRAPNPQPQFPHASPTQAAQMPQIIVVAPPQQQLPSHLLPYGNDSTPQAVPALSAPMQERTFKIVGEEDSD
jgi:hypothetical protein